MSNRSEKLSNSSGVESNVLPPQTRPQAVYDALRGIAVAGRAVLPEILRLALYDAERAADSAKLKLRELVQGPEITDYGPDDQELMK